MTSSQSPRSPAASLKPRQEVIDGIIRLVGKDPSCLSKPADVETMIFGEFKDASPIEIERALSAVLEVVYAKAYAEAPLSPDFQNTVKRQAAEVTQFARNRHARRRAARAARG